MRYVLAIIFLLLSKVAFAAIYYVDYTDGVDSANGTSSSTPWKHSPGDSNATGNAAITLSAGDTVNFKGGVRYQGKIAVNASGNDGSRIVFQGQPSGWGTGKAIIDGTVTTSWTQCPDASTCGGNANYANIYYATLPGGANHDITVLDSDVPLYHQIDVTVADPHNYTIVEEWHAISSGMGATTCTDAAVFTSSDENYYTGAYIYHHQWSGNSLGRSKIASFNTGTDTITYANLGYTVSVDSTWDSKYHYAIVNNWRAINAAGYYAVDEDNSKIYAWPRTSTSNLRIGSLTYAFDANSKSYFTVDGFKIVGQYNPSSNTGIALVGNSGVSTNGIDFKNNDLISQAGGALGSISGNIYMRSGGAVINYVRDNTMSWMTNGRGITVSGGKVYTQRNTFEYIHGTVIFYFVNTGLPSIDGEIDGNLIQNCAGIHANGMALYGLSSDIVENIVVKNNRIPGFGSRAGPYAMTMQTHRNLTFYNNVLGETQEQGRGADCDYMRWYNNTMLDFDKADGNDEGFVMTEDPSNCTEYTVKGNIMDGFGSAHGYPTHTYNVYTNYYWTQDTGTYGWELGATEVLSTLTDVFNNYAAGDYTLKSGGPAIDFLPTAQAPTALFTTDVLSASRPVGSAWDAGAYEYGNLNGGTLSGGISGQGWQLR
jgi:hypothetical protein